MSILENTRPTDTIGKALTADALKRHWKRLGIAKASWLLQRIRREDGPFRGVNVALDVVAPMLVKDMLICFDDFERVNSERISHEELMGLISTLKESANCKIAMILNDEKLPDNGVAYTTYREKVVDLELQFSPSVADAIKWGFPSELPYRELATDTALKLGITNVRVLKKIADVIALLVPLAGSREEVRRETVLSVIVLGWCYFDASGQAPPLAFVQKWNTMAQALKSENQAPSMEEVRWAALMNEWKFGEYDEFDAAVLKAIQQGYVEDSGFVDEVRKRTAIYDAGDLEAEVRSTWELFHESLDDNTSEVIDAIDGRFRKAAQILSPADLNSGVVLMRKLGQSEKADALIAHYIQARQTDATLFDLRKLALAPYITDNALKAAFAAQYSVVRKKVPLRQAVETMAKGQGWSLEDQGALEAASVDDLYALFKGPLSVKRNSAIRACLQFNSPPDDQIRERAKEALRRIAEESPINAIRLAPYGVVAMSGNQVEPDGTNTVGMESQDDGSA